jgi:hypothetical protein
MYNTSNTRLAAALKAMGFTLVSWEKEAGRQMAFSFADGVQHGKNANEYNQLWRDKEWHGYNNNHPFCQIVKAAEARDWIINRVIHDTYQETGGEADGNYYVYDINIAACIIAEGYYLLRFTERRFYFVSQAQTIHRAYMTPEHGSSLWWQCNYLKQLKLLMGLVPREKNKLDKLYASA